MTLIIVRMIRQSDGVKLVKFLAEHGGRVTETSAGNRGMFYTIEIPDAAVDKMGDIGFSETARYWRDENAVKSPSDDSLPKTE